MRLRDLSPSHVRALKARKLDAGMDPSTMGVMQGVLSAALNQAVVDGLIVQNPCSRVRKTSKRGNAPVRFLSQEEARGLLAAASGTRDEALVTLALRTGMRQGELAALRWGDLDGPRPSVRVARSADTRTKTVVTPTKTGEERVVRLGPRTIEVLGAHRNRQREERMAAPAWDDPGSGSSRTRGAR